MPAPNYQADLDKARSLLEEWIGRTTTGEWLQENRSAVEEGAPDWKFFTAFSAAPQHVGKAGLELSEKDLKAADEVRRGWYPHYWSADQAARALLVLSYPHGDRVRFVRALEQLFSTADVRESVALYQCLPLLPYPKAFTPRAAEGVRSNMTSVFNAVAHHNPYPAEYLDENAWNQMVLKALFVGSPLYPIHGFDERVNPKLARMLVDYAHERWAAQRTVSPELWRAVGPYGGHYLEELGIALANSDEHQREAAALALADAESKKADEMLSQQPDLQEAIRSGRLTWGSFSREQVPV